LVGGPYYQQASHYSITFQFGDWEDTFSSPRQVMTYLSCRTSAGQV
jgi:hypothetical protein